MPYGHISSHNAAFIWCCDLVTKSNAVFCCHQQQNRLVSFLWQDKIGGEMRSMNHEEVWASDVLIINTHWLYPLVKHSYQTNTDGADLVCRYIIVCLLWLSSTLSSNLTMPRCLANNSFTIFDSALISLATFLRIAA